MASKKLSTKELESVNGGTSGGVNGLIATVTGCKHRCNVRKGPSASSTILGYTHLGDRYPFLGYSGKWVRVEYGEGVAYISEKFITVS